MVTFVAKTLNMPTRYLPNIIPHDLFQVSIPAGKAKRIVVKPDDNENEHKEGVAVLPRFLPHKHAIAEGLGLA
jgi:hypothetical protein